MFRKRLMQRLAVAFLLIAVSFSGIMTAAAATTDRFYISRIIAWREGEFRDFEKFPSRPVPAGPETFFFKPASERTPEYLRTVSYRRDAPDPTTPRPPTSPRVILLANSRTARIWASKRSFGRRDRS